jgi:hypothetical protein
MLYGLFYKRIMSLCAPRLGCAITAKTLLANTNDLRIPHINEFKEDISMEKGNIVEELKQIREYWKPYIFGELARGKCWSVT